MPKITQLLNGRACIQIQAVWFQRPCCYLVHHAGSRTREVHCPNLWINLNFLNWDFNSQYYNSLIWTMQSSGFRIFSVLCNHQYNLVLEQFYHPISKISYPVISHSCSLPTARPGNHCLYSVSRDLLILDILHKQKHTIFGTTYNIIETYNWKIQKYTHTHENYKPTYNIWSYVTGLFHLT